MNLSQDVFAGRIPLNGPVGGRVRADGGQLELGPLARVGGEFRTTATTFMRDPGAQNYCQLTRVDQVFSEESRRERGASHARRSVTPSGVVATVVAAVPGAAGCLFGLAAGVFQVRGACHAADSA